MESLLLQLNQLQSWQIGLLASYLLYQGFFVSVFPEEVIATTLGLLWGEGKIGFFHALISIWVGLLPANATTVFVGSRFGPKLLSMRPFCWLFKKEAVSDALELVKRNGAWVVIVTRFVPMIRGPLYLATGLSQMAISHFVRLDLLASCIQIPCLLMIGRMIGKNASSLMDAYRKIGILMIALFLGAAVLKYLSSLKDSTKSSSFFLNRGIIRSFLKSSRERGAPQHNNPNDIYPH